MKEREFTKSSDKQNWMDTSVISDIPFKVTIIDARPFVDGVKSILECFECIEELKCTDAAIEHLAKVMVHSFMTGIVARRRAWINGDDVEYLLHTTQLREMIGVDIDPKLRDEIRYDLGEMRHRNMALRFDQLIGEIMELLSTHMNPNHFVVHEIEQTRDLRTFVLKEYADWRVIQWTKEQQAKIDSRHEEI